MAILAFWKGLPEWVKGLIGAVVLLGLVWILVDAHGDARFREGRLVEKAAVDAANAALLAKAAESGVEAAKAEKARQEARMEAVSAEREKIDENIEAGRSPFDGLDGFSLPQ